MRKSDIEDGYRGLAEAVRGYEARRAEIGADANLSAEGRAAAASDAYEASGIDGKRAALASMLADAATQHRQARADALKARLTDTEYQARVNDACGLIAGGYLSGADDLRAVSELFAGDHVALGRLADAATEAGAQADPFRHSDTYAREARNLASMRETLEALDVRNDAGGALLALDGGADYLARLDDAYSLASDAGAFGEQGE